MTHTQAAAPIPPDAAVFAFHTGTRDQGEHLIWEGPVKDHRSQIPITRHGNRVYPVRRIAWRAHHGTAPVGHVRVTCNERRCLAKGHLADDTTRAREQQLLANLHGRHLTGTCHRGHDRALYGLVRSTGVFDCRRCDTLRHTPPADTTA